MKKKKIDNDSRMSFVLPGQNEREGGEEKTEKKQSIPKDVQFTLIVWPWDECRLIRGVNRHRTGVEWTGPMKELAGQLKLLEKGEYVSVVEVSTDADGKYLPCPALDTVDTLIYYGEFNKNLVIDFPMEVLTLSRLERLQFHWVDLRRIPPEILETKIKWISFRKVQEPPLFLLENSCEIEWAKPLPWESGIEDQLKPFKHLRQLLLLGLGEKNPTPWSSFLKLHRLHDPRLFLFVAEFLK